MNAVAHALPSDDDPRSFVLRSELSEVYLLLDNISSSPESAAPWRRPRRIPGWIASGCRTSAGIDWPPDDARQDIAADAALLIRVKDHLNTLAQPASRTDDRLYASGDAGGRR
ncbi:hypothetical protein AB5I41_06775 [Sphingomonas sp. MMS24-JH45]